MIVQHIGERMLGKLLAAGISVSQGDNAESIEVLLSQTQLMERRLLDASQGRASLNHAKKGGCCASGGDCGSAEGGCGCGGHKPMSEVSSLLQKPESAQGELASVSYSGFRPLS